MLNSVVFLEQQRVLTFRDIRTSPVSLSTRNFQQSSIQSKTGSFERQRKRIEMWICLRQKGKQGTKFGMRLQTKICFIFVQNLQQNFEITKKRIIHIIENLIMRNWCKIIKLCLKMWNKLIEFDLLHIWYLHKQPKLIHQHQHPAHQFQHTRWWHCAAANWVRDKQWILGQYCCWIRLGCFWPGC